MKHSNAFVTGQEVATWTALQESQKKIKKIKEKFFVTTQVACMIFPN